MESCINGDKAGIIWFGTQEGASRYAGTSFRNFTMKEVPSPAYADSIKSFYHKPTPHSPTMEENYWLINGTDDRVHTIIEDKTGEFLRPCTIKSQRQPKLSQEETVFLGFKKLVMEVFGLDLRTEFIVMMERPLKDFKGNEGQK